MKKNCERRWTKPLLCSTSIKRLKGARTAAKGAGLRNSKPTEMAKKSRPECDDSQTSSQADAYGICLINSWTEKVLQHGHNGTADRHVLIFLSIPLIGKGHVIVDFFIDTTACFGGV